MKGKKYIISTIVDVPFVFYNDSTCKEYRKGYKYPIEANYKRFETNKHSNEIDSYYYRHFRTRMTIPVQMMASAVLQLIFCAF